MSAANRDAISEVLGVEPVLINSKHFTAQLRSRYYWTNLTVDMEFPETSPALNDILESGWSERQKSYCVTATYSRACTQDYFNHTQRQMVWKSIPPTAVCEYKGQDDFYQIAKPYMRKLLPIECERLQGLQDEYTKCDGVPNGQRYNAIGNGFTVPVISWILKDLRNEYA
jgi:site-specific DNA-cytosine methylase